MFVGIDVGESYPRISLKSTILSAYIASMVSLPSLGGLSRWISLLTLLFLAHPSPNSRLDAPSIGAYVANVSGNQAQFPVVIRFQRKEGKQAEESAKHIKEVIRLFLGRWLELHNGTLPENIMVFRDGVSEGQFGVVRQVEVEQVKEACKAACADATELAIDKDKVVKDISLTFIICGQPSFALT